MHGCDDWGLWLRVLYLHGRLPALAFGGLLIHSRAKKGVDMKLDVLLASFLKHAVVEDVCYLRDLTGRVHYRHLLYYAQRPLYLGLNALHCI